jgi:catechol 2,3-dioxygenase-like lactoylglutathione lyase family enzyme
MKRLFDHIDLRVRRLSECEGFYRALLPKLGFTEQATIEGWLQFESQGTEPTEFFGITEDPNHKPNQTRIAFWAESRQQVDALAALLSSIGALKIEGPDFESPSYYAVYFEDPSHNRLEICFRTERFNPFHTQANS